MFFNFPKDKNHIFWHFHIQSEKEGRRWFNPSDPLYFNFIMLLSITPQPQKENGKKKHFWMILVHSEWHACIHGNNDLVIA
jgi:hypothetical protein